MKRTAVVGAGIGGLCTAILLAMRGQTVEVFEKNDVAGGKLWGFEAEGFRFSYGPSTLTMPWLFTEMAEQSGLGADILPYRRLPILHRNIFADGRSIDACESVSSMQQQIRAFSDADAAAWPHYLRDANRLYDLAMRHFFTRSFTRLREFASLPLLRAVLATRPQRSLSGYHRLFFKDPQVLMLVDRYATYVGSDPTRAPATLGMIGHIEYGTGVHYLPGGTVGLIHALLKICERLEVDVHTSSPVSEIVIRNGIARGLRVRGETVPFDAICVAADVGYATRHLIATDAAPTLWRKRVTSGQLSHSGFVLLLGVNRRYDHLAHHTVFYPSDYQGEFRQLFGQPSPLKDPTIYICNTSASDSTQAPAGGCNLFVLVNAPANLEPVDDATWVAYEDHLIDLLEHRCGLPGLRTAIVVRQRVTPDDLATRTHTFGGAIYGLASNSVQSAFLRPPMRVRGIDRLYFVGGSTHPGGGTPMVALSARLAAGLVDDELRQRR
ncbi:MAG: phytoene desaturase family protein [Firmicutes bacterium]|nr:phytoene desaturase family protein [Bacillota bacterium]